MLQDYADDPDLLAYLESTKDLLRAHFNEHYASHAHSLNRAADTHTQAVTDDSPSKVNFTLRYKKKDGICAMNLRDISSCLMKTLNPVNLSNRG